MEYVLARPSGCAMYVCWCVCCVYIVHTIYGFALGEVTVVLAGEEIVAHTADYAFEEAAVDVEEEAFHCWRWFLVS